MVLVKPPDIPVMVTVAVPVAAVLLAVSVNVLVLAVLLGLNDAVTPLGRPDADKPTLPLKPFCGVTVMVLAPLAPCAIVKLLGEVEREKFGGGAKIGRASCREGEQIEEAGAVRVRIPEAACLVSAQ